MVTESGHELHWDDTKDKERVRFAHMSGTYFEMSPDGRRVDLTTGHHVLYSKGGITETSDKNHDYKVHGSVRQSVSGHQHQEIKGDYTSATGKDRKQITGGDYTAATKGDFSHGVVGDHLQTVGGHWRVKADKSAEIKTTGDALDHTSSTKTIKAQTIILEADTVIVRSGDIRLGGDGANRELGLKGSTDDDSELNGPDALVGNLSTTTKAI